MLTNLLSKVPASKKKKLIENVFNNFISSENISFANEKLKSEAGADFVMFAPLEDGRLFIYLIDKNFNVKAKKSMDEILEFFMQVDANELDKAINENTENLDDKNG